VSDKKPFKTYALAKATLFEPNDKAIAKTNAALKQIGGEKTKNLLPQTDLLYVKSVLVTAGMNANDDVFFVDELWDARYSPILKPLDWLHNEQEIIGVMYNVSARDINDGAGIDLELEHYDKPFEIISEGVVYKLLFADRANEIVRGTKAGDLFVSMECWFDNYDYVVFNNGNIERIIKRSGDTSFLDASLKAFGGSGFFDDPDSDGFKRIGRGLRNLTFGGCGFVPRPANKRSVIEVVGDTEEPHENKVIESDAEQNLVCADSNKEDVMTNEKDLVKASVKEVLDEQAEVSRIKDLEKKARTLATVQEEKNSLEAQIELMTRQRDNILSAFTDTMQEIVKIVAAEAPPEIAAIDAASDDVEAAFQAKLSWIQKSVGSMAEKVEAASEYKEKLDALAKDARRSEVNELLCDVNVGDEALSGLIENALAMCDEDYTKWFDEKKLLIDSMKAESSDNSEDEESAADGGEDSAEASSDENNSDGDETDSAEADENEVSEKVLDNVEEDDQPNLAGATSEPEDNDPDGVKQLAADLHPTEENEDNEDEKSEFDFLNHDE